MKKFLAILMILCMLFQLVSCTDSGSVTDDDRDEIEEDEENIIDETSSVGNAGTDTTAVAIEIDMEKVIEVIEDTLDEEIESSIEDLCEEWEELETDITTIEEYIENIDRVKSFYEKIVVTSENLTFKMYEYSLIYAEYLVAYDVPCENKYAYLENIYDSVHDYAVEEIYEEIYEEILDDVYDTFYDDVIYEGYAYYSDSPYEWKKIRSNEYEMWDDTCKNVSNMCEDTQDDIYNFFEEIREQLYSKNIEGLNEIVQDFKYTVEKMRK